MIVDRGVTAFICVFKFAFLTSLLFESFSLASVTELKVDPFSLRKIGGISEVKRETYFGLSDPGLGFDARVKSNERYDYLINELQIDFGRRLGVVHPVVMDEGLVLEDPSRAGFCDLQKLKESLKVKKKLRVSGKFSQDFPDGLEVVAHGDPNAFPEFMGKQLASHILHGKRRYIPTNLEAAAELSAHILKWDYQDFERPVYYELVNEPHWSFWPDSNFQKWHLLTLEKVKSMGLDVQVGGPCLPVAYYYKEQYKKFKGIRSFIDGTKGKLDFYSFHVYDFLRKNGKRFDGGGHTDKPTFITSGLPLHSILDLVSNYTVNGYGREPPIVVSEHGAYGAMDLVEELANEYFPGDGFDWEMKMRSIAEFNKISGIIANTMVFMDHPHIVKKAVPFILLESMYWDPKYYSTLYVPYDFTDKQRWVETKLSLFYRLMRDVEGQRVWVHSDDPDVQIHAVAQGAKTYVLLNNLSNNDHDLNWDLPTPESAVYRSLSRAFDYTPSYSEKNLSISENGLGFPVVLKARESAVMVLNYGNEISFIKASNEEAYYGNKTLVPVDKNAEFEVKVPKADSVIESVIRVGISRPGNSGHQIQISLNGKELWVPLENATDRIDNGIDYASCKIIPVPPGLLEEENSISVSFSDGHAGSVGSVVIRASFPE